MQDMNIARPDVDTSLWVLELGLQMWYMGAVLYASKKLENAADPPHPGWKLAMAEMLAAAGHVEEEREQSRKQTRKEEEAKKSAERAAEKKLYATMQVSDYTESDVGAMGREQAGLLGTGAS